MTRLLNCWAYKSEQESIALKALIFGLALFLQKNILILKVQEKSETLKRRLYLWKNGQIDQLSSKVKQFKTKCKKNFLKKN